MSIRKIAKMLENFCIKNLGKLALITGLVSDSKDALINLIVIILIISIINGLCFKKAKSCFSKLINKEVPCDKNDVHDIKNNEEPSQSENDKEFPKPKFFPSVPSSNEDVIKNNIKMMCKKIDEQQSELKKRVKFDGPYKNEVNLHEKNYKVKPDNYDFNININESTCAMPIFHLRTHDKIDFYYNFIIHNFDPKKINDLIMCKDIHKFMSTSSLTSDDISDELAPIYFIKKDSHCTEVYEYLKIFIYTDEDNNKIGFVQKGNDYLYVKNDIELLISNGLIGDLLMNKHYINYNLSVNEGVTEFLERLLSLVLIPELLIGNDLKVSIENYYENARAFEYHYNTLNCTSTMFRSSI